MSRRTIYILAGLGLVVVVVAAWFLLLAPIRNEITQVEASIATEQTVLAQNQAKLAQMEQTRLLAEANQARLMELAKMVPQDIEMPSLLLQVQDMATESGIDFLHISNSEAEEYGSYFIVPLSLELEGTYFDLNDFIYRAEQMVAGPGRLMAVKDLAYNLVDDASAASSPELAADMTLRAFVLPVQAPAEPESLTPDDNGSTGGESSTTNTTQGG